MKRQEFIFALAGAAFARPLTARAQPAKKLPVVGFILSDVPPADMAGPDPGNPLARGFVHGLRDLGWVEGRTVVIEGGRRKAAPSALRSSSRS